MQKIQRTGYTYPEIAAILNSKRDGKSSAEIKEMLEKQFGIKRTPGGIALLLKQHEAYTTGRNIQIYNPSVTVKALFVKYKNEAKEQSEIKRQDSSANGEKNTGSYAALVGWFKQGDVVISDYIEAEVSRKVAEQTEALEKEVQELREYKQKIKELA